MSRSEPFNRVELLEEFEGDLRLLARLFGTFRADCENRLPKMNAALDAGDLAALANEAHAIKSGVGNFFATRAYRSACELETSAEKGDADETRERMKEFEGEIREVIGALDALCTPA